MITEVGLQVSQLELPQEKRHIKQQRKQQIKQPAGQQKETWIICPACHNKTRTRVRADTVLLNFPLYCPKCKQEHLINVKQLHISVITEPDAQMQSR